MGQRAVGYLVKRLDAAFKSAMDEALVCHDLSTATYAALHHLHFVGAMSSSDLARASWVTPQSMHRLVQALKKRAFVEVESTQGRTSTLALTDAGRDAFLAALVDVKQIESKMVAGLSKAKVEELRVLLETCRESLA